MPKQTKGKRNAHAPALLFPIPIGIQEILAHLSIADQTKVYQYLNRIRRAVLGLSVGPVPLRSERAPLYDCMAKILEATPDAPEHSRQTSYRTVRSIRSCAHRVSLPAGSSTNGRSCSPMDKSTR